MQPLAKHTVFNAYKSFEQKIAVHTALNLPNGHTLLISLPTGGGKSLVTQLLASVSEGLTVVIVPPSPWPWISIMPHGTT